MSLLALALMLLLVSGPDLSSTPVTRNDAPIDVVPVSAAQRDRAAERSEKFARAPAASSSRTEYPGLVGGSA